jgi:hypothetical protein
MVIEKLYESCDIYQCEICLDNHDTKSVVITCCGHSFGTECFKRWRNTCFVNHRDTVSCPTCRKSDPDTTCFVLHSG